MDGLNLAWSICLTLASWAVQSETKIHRWTTRLRLPMVIPMMPTYVAPLNLRRLMTNNISMSQLRAQPDSTIPSSSSILDPFNVNLFKTIRPRQIYLFCQLMTMTKYVLVFSDLPYCTDSYVRYSHGRLPLPTSDLHPSSRTLDLVIAFVYIARVLPQAKLNSS